QGDHPPSRPELERIAAVADAQGLLDHVHADDHARATAVGGVVHLAGAERRGGAQVDGVELVPEPERVAHVTLVAEPVEPAGEEREDVDLHEVSSSRPRKARSTRILRPSRSMSLIASEMKGMSTPSGPTSRTSQDGPRTTRVTSPKP